MAAIVGSYFSSLLTLAELDSSLVSNAPEDKGWNAFLNRTLLASSAPIELTINKDHAASMHEVLCRAQERLFRACQGNDRPDNIITMGFGVKRVLPGSREVPQYGLSLLLHCYAQNSTYTHLLNSRHWLRLVGQLGAHAVTQMLCHPDAALFEHLEDKDGKETSNLIQVSGKPILEKDTPKEIVYDAQGGKKRKVEMPGQRKAKRAKVASEPTPAPVAGTKGKKRPSNATLQEDQPPFKKTRTTQKKPSETLIPRHKMFYSRPTFNPKPTSAAAPSAKRRTRKPVQGLSEGHVLTKLSSAPPTTLTTSGPSTKVKRHQRVLQFSRHVFPSQFGLPSMLDVPAAVATMAKQQQGGANNRALGRTGTGLRSFGTTGTGSGFGGSKTSLQSVSEPPRKKKRKGTGGQPAPKRFKDGEGAYKLTRTVLRNFEDKLGSRRKFGERFGRLCPSGFSKRKLSTEDEAYMADITSSSVKLQTQATPHSLEVSHSSLIVPPEKSRALALKPSCLEHVQPVGAVQAYVRSVVAALIPKWAWGGKRNWELVRNHIDAFVALRRFETFSLHTLMHGFSVADCDWLVLRSAARGAGQKANQDEMKVRKRMVMEWLGWLFESFLVDLLRTSFYITESQVTRNRVLYFRHDDWAEICRPKLNELTTKMFQHIPNSQAHAMFKTRKLMYSYLRLLPKENGTRPIMNLRRRIYKPGTNKLNSDPSWGINTILKNAFQVVTHEKDQKPELMAGSVLGPHEIYPRIKALKKKLLKHHGGKIPKLYFVKVDVTGCFDTIKQQKLLKILAEMLEQEEYRMVRYGQVHPRGSRVERKFVRKAVEATTSWDFVDVARETATSSRNTVFTEQTAMARPEPKNKVLDLVEEHIKANLVKIRGRFYKQREGIPQGSIMSSLLCSLYYGKLDTEVLSFTKDELSLLMRYIDDFMMITPKRHLAVKFLQIMSKGLPEYNCFISTDKTLTNFDVSIDPGTIIRATPHLKTMIWCGHLVDTATLDVRSGNTLYETGKMSDTLTVERNQKPGQSLVYKMLKIIKSRSHVMYTDTTHNSVFSVYLNVYQTFLVVAMKSHAYILDWQPGSLRKRPSYFFGLFSSMISYGYVAAILSVDGALGRAQGAKCSVRRGWVSWLGFHAFHRVLAPHSRMYGTPLLRALRHEVDNPKAKRTRQALRKVTSDSTNAFTEYFENL